MRDFIGLEPFVDEAFARRTDHRFHAMGTAISPDAFAPSSNAAKERDRMARPQPWSTETDIAWIICLYRCGAIDRDRAATVLKGLDQTWDMDVGVSGEERLLQVFDGDYDLASTVNYGRTLQEPMYRLKLRDKLLDVLDDLLGLLQLVHKLAMANLDTIMVGHTHMNHGQPMTYAHFMVSVFDGLARGLQQLELAWAFTNVNSGGCGSCSGIAWPVDRELMADLLGFDGVMEPTYDCEASQDHSLSILFALSNISIHISRYAMNHYIWMFDEIDMMRTQPSMCGMSSFMPQKCDSGTWYERTRIYAADVLGETVTAMFSLKGEPHMDVLPAMQLPNNAVEGMIRGQTCIQQFTNQLNYLVLNKERMRAILRAGYSCTTELAYYLIRNKGVGGRLAHSIVATMTRQARARGLRSYECTGQMLDEAARYLSVPEPGLDTATVRQCLDPDEFLKSHTHLGGTAPAENQRLLEKRRGSLDRVVRRHEERKAKIKNARAAAMKAAKEIMQ